MVDELKIPLFFNLKFPMEIEKIKANLKKENTQEGGGWIGIKKKLFKHKKIKHNRNK